MAQNPWRRTRPLAIAHRGHSIEYPENTTAAYKKAIELGAEMIECDVNITRDGVLVMMHDPTRLTDGIEPSDDPILAIRRGVYEVSVAYRTGGWKGRQAASAVV